MQSTCKDTSVLPMEEGEDEEWSAELVVDVKAAASPEERRAQSVKLDVTPTDNSHAQQQNNNNNNAVTTINNNNNDEVLAAAATTRPSAEGLSGQTGLETEMSTFSSKALPPEDETESSEDRIDGDTSKRSSSSSSSGNNSISNNSNSSSSSNSYIENNNSPNLRILGPETTNFSSFLYWREPVPDLELVDIDLGARNVDEDTEMMEVDQQTQQRTTVTEDEDELMPELAVIKEGLSNLDTDSSTEESAAVAECSTKADNSGSRHQGESGEEVTELSCEKESEANLLSSSSESAGGQNISGENIVDLIS